MVSNDDHEDNCDKTPIGGVVKRTFGNRYNAMAYLLVTQHSNKIVMTIEWDQEKDDYDYDGDGLNCCYRVINIYMYYMFVTWTRIKSAG